MREGERIVVECNQLGQPIKKAACLLTSFLGIVARRPQLCPLGYAKWNDMLPTYKVKLLRVIEVDEHGRECGKVEFYRMTHTHQDGTFARDESRDLYERATFLITERDDESAASTQQSRIEAEVFTELMGPEHYGRVRGYGVGVTSTQLSEVSRYTQHAAADAQDSRVRRLEAEIQKIRQSRAAEIEEMRQSRAEMQVMRRQIDRLTSLLEMLLAYQASVETAARHVETATMIRPQIDIILFLLYSYIYLYYF
ncbi:uncharacterized protein [Elaeis guineensis]|uniref:uncharacterized protein isoform X4 n=1 Tax=Elaeis guineensis var. tenera TaxID=51953 RepID=UPI003C6D7CA5